MFQDTLHKYYTHTVEQGKDYFYDLDHHNFTGPNRGKVKEHDMLSQSYRRAATINPFAVMHAVLVFFKVSSENLDF